MIKTSYLIIWQLGDNEQSRTESAIDVEFIESWNASRKLLAIEVELNNQHPYFDPNRSGTIIGIFKL